MRYPRMVAKQIKRILAANLLELAFHESLTTEL